MYHATFHTTYIIIITLASFSCLFGYTFLWHALRECNWNTDLFLKCHSILRDYPQNFRKIKWKNEKLSLLKFSSKTNHFWCKVPTESYLYQRLTSHIPSCQTVMNPFLFHSACNKACLKIIKGNVEKPTVKWRTVSVDLSLQYSCCDSNRWLLSMVFLIS